MKKNPLTRGVAQRGLVSSCYTHAVRAHDTSRDASRRWWFRWYVRNMFCLSRDRKFWLRKFRLREWWHASRGACTRASRALSAIKPMNINYNLHDINRHYQDRWAKFSRAPVVADTDAAAFLRRPKLTVTEFSGSAHGCMCHARTARFLPRMFAGRGAVPVSCIASLAKFSRRARFSIFSVVPSLVE